MRVKEHISIIEYDACHVRGVLQEAEDTAHTAHLIDRYTYICRSKIGIHVIACKKYKYSALAWYQLQYGQEYVHMYKI